MPFTIPNRPSGAGTNIQSQAFEADIAILVAALSGTGVVSGCAVTAQGSPDMTVAVAAGTILAAGVPVAVTGGNLTVGAADGTNPRLDLISASASGVKTITAGTAAAAPKPADLPAGHIGLAFVYVAAADTAIGSTEITDKRAIIRGGSLDADCTANASLSADTPADATGATISLFAGTWQIFGQLTIDTGAANYCLMYITDSSNAVVGQARNVRSTASPVTLMCMAKVSPGSTTTYKLRGQIGASGTILRYAEGTNIGTRIWAIRTVA